jgi:hygromycin-B 7''-O-kinase
VRLAEGSLPVYATGELVLKLFPPVHKAACHIEAGVLTAIEGRLPAATPRVHGAGEHDGWGYVLMSRLPGVLLTTVWDQATAGDRDHLAGQLGETIAALHGVPPPPIDNWWPASWPDFVARQRAQCVQRQADLGLAPAWAEQLPGFLDDVRLGSGPLVLLHTEIMAQHLLVTQTGAGFWRLSGRGSGFAASADRLRLPQRPARPRARAAAARLDHLAPVQQPRLLDAAAARTKLPNSRRGRRTLVRNEIDAPATV